MPRWLKTLLVLFVVLGLLRSVSAATLSNGQQCYIGKSFTNALLGSKKANHDDIRAFEKQIDAIKNVEKRLRAQGINMSRPVHFRYYTDLNFPARDLWVSAGLSADKKGLDTYVEDMGMVFCSMSAYEFAHAADKANDKYFFLDPFSDWIRKEEAFNPKSIAGKLLDSIMSGTKNQRKRIESGLDSNVKGQGDYEIFNEPGYNPVKKVLWVPIKKAGALHRYLGISVHEYGHHAFSQLVHQLLNKNNSRKKWTDPQLFYACGNLSAVDEFFADYVALSNGYTVCVQLHDLSSPIQDMKRKFSQKRTLKDYLQQIKEASAKNKKRLTECHNSLNPMRSFIWQLRLAVGSQNTDKIFYAGIKRAILQYFNDIPKFKKQRIERSFGCFIVKGYPKDVATENLRLLKHFETAAKAVLSKENMVKFNSISQEIFAGF